MPEYRRNKLQGGTYFFTVVTYQRRPILTGERERAILHNAIIDVQNRFPFETIAICLLPEHIHCIWQLPENDDNYSVRWKEIKRLFTKDYIAQIGSGGWRNTSHVKKNEASLWQRRFWEHTIRDEKDLNNHIDYIHYNPVKHGLVQAVFEYPWSSFHRYVKEGFYEKEWGSNIDEKCFDDGAFGE
jgi:putative transposase